MAACPATRIAMASGMRTASVRCSDIWTVTWRSTTSGRSGRGWHCSRNRDGRARYARVPARVRTQPWRGDETTARGLSSAPPAGDGVLSGDRRPPGDHAAGRPRSVAAWLRVAASRRGQLPSPARLRHRGTRLRARRLPVVSVRDPRPVQLQSPRAVPVVRWPADGGWCGRSGGERVDTMRLLLPAASVGGHPRRHSAVVAIASMGCASTATSMAAASHAVFPGLPRACQTQLDSGGDGLLAGRLVNSRSGAAGHGQAVLRADDGHAFAGRRIPSARRRSRAERRAAVTSSISSQ